MTQARTRANGLVTPSLPQLWLTAMLRAFVELVRNAVSTLRMARRRLPAECHSDVTPADLPGQTSGNQQQEAKSVAASDTGQPEALILSSTQSVRPSKDEGVLTDVSYPLAHHRDRDLIVPLFPAKAGTQSCKETRAAIPHTRTPPWIPASAGMIGDRAACITAPA